MLRIPQEFQEAAKLIETQFPNEFAKAYPKQIIPPSQDYANPRYYAADVICCAMQRLHSSMPGFIGGMNICCQKLIDHESPTYFVHPAFLRAIAATDLEDDFEFSGLKWPMEAMLFVLPLSVSEELFGKGVMVPWLAVARAPEGEYKPSFGNYTTNFAESRLTIHFPVFDGTRPLPEDYGGMWPLSGKLVQLLKTVPFLDATCTPVQGQDGALLEERNQAIYEKGVKLAVSLLLGIVARPEYITLGKCVRQAKPNPRPHKAITALWEANIVGKGYVEKRESFHHATQAEHDAAVQALGTSKRTHRRRGHFRNQVIGSTSIPLEQRPRKLIWIEPMWINL